MEKKISIIMPVYNEEKFISKCLDSLVLQTYDLKNADFIVIDGLSTDRTLEIIDNYKNKLGIRVLLNEKRKVTCALNIGIDAAVGDYIIRLDAHSVYYPDYIEKCIYYLENTDADNVGGLAITDGSGFMGKINADILSSKFGVGGSKFRTNACSGYVDTVPFGAFRKEVFDVVGKFNPDLPRSEDNDINSRIRENGGKVYLSSDIRFTYYCRDTLKGLLEQAIKNGNALFFTLKKNKNAMSLRHFVPLAFFASVVGLLIIGCFVPKMLYVLLFELSLYLILDLYFSLTAGNKKLWLFKVALYPVFHLTYGVGSFLSLLSIRLY